MSCKDANLGFAGDYKLLGTDADEQCSVGRGGLLCKSCAEDYQYTFLSVSCVASSTCEWWQPYLVLVITLVFQLMIEPGYIICSLFHSHGIPVACCDACSTNWFSEQSSVKHHCLWLY